MILHRLRDHAARNPSAPVLKVLRDGREWAFDYCAFWQETERWAAHFSALKLEPRSVVFIVLKHGVEQYFAYFGAMRAGLIPSFLAFATPKQNAQLYWATHRELFRDIRPGALITYAENVGALAEAAADIGVPVLSTDELREIEPDAPPPLTDDENAVAFLQFSSGTTGLRKGVQITFRQLQNQIDSYADSIGAGPTDRIVSWLPLYHDMGLIACCMLPLQLGASVVSLDPFEWVARPQMMFEAIETHRSTMGWIPNFAFAHLVRTVPEDTRYDLSSMRAFISTSEPCKPETFQAFLNRFGSFGIGAKTLQTSYAMAETVFGITQTPLDGIPNTLIVSASRLARHGEVVEVLPEASDAQAFLSCGTPIRDISVRVKTDGLYPAGGRVGEFQVAGSFVFDGYYRNPEANKAAFDADGWYSTGDVGFLYGGQLYVCGRKKEMLIVHGRNYYANDIEQVLNRVRGVKPGRVVAVGLFDETTQSEEAIALVEVDPKTEVDRAELRRAIKRAVYDELELTLKTVELMEPESLIKTTSGKTSRNENLKLYLDSRTKPVNANG
jgi:acyl-CoA synthetase (AMP-forming)/AMP-acid ligase II